MKPSDLIGKFPYDSVMHNNESEIVAYNLVVILYRTGDAFREIDWDEYWRERISDDANQAILYEEMKYFNSVKRYLVSEQTARLFSKVWDMK